MNHIVDDSLIRIFRNVLQETYYYFYFFLYILYYTLFIAVTNKYIRTMKYTKIACIVAIEFSNKKKCLN